MRHGTAVFAEKDDFDTIIDVRSPSEFTDDHIPGAINCPVLDDAQRAEVGTIYKQTSPFEARKLGAALIATNIARHLREQFSEKPKSWRPFVYCWRGGMRSEAMVTILRSVGWNAARLEGGYKSYRNAVVAALEQLPRKFGFIVIGGATGSGKTRILQALGNSGGQILDLESIACHKGSILGIMPGRPQPSQKWFESELAALMERLDPSSPVFIEAESRKIGNLHVPEALIGAMRGSPCLIVDASPPARVDFLLRDYDYLPQDPAALKSRLDALRGLQANETLASWKTMVDGGQWRPLVADLLERHYDPLYRRSQDSNFACMGVAPRYVVDDLSEGSIRQLAERILHDCTAQIA